jgi:hypothetical protein
VGHGLAKLKPDPETCRARLVRAAFPEFPMVNIFVAEELTATVPKSRDVELVTRIATGAGAEVSETSVGEFTAFDWSAS